MWQRRVLWCCRALSLVCLVAVGFVLFHGGGKWQLGGFRIRLDRPTNPLLLLALFQGIAAWVGARRGDWRAAWPVRLHAAARAAGWVLLAFLIVTLPMDRNLAWKSTMPWRRPMVAFAVGAFVLAALLRRPRDKEPDVPEPNAAPGLSLRWFLPASAGPGAERSVLDAPTWGLAALTVWAGISVYFSPFPAEALEGWVNGWLMALGLYAATRLALREGVRAEAFGTALAAALGLTILLALLQMHFGYGRFDLAAGLATSLRERLAAARATGLSLHPNYLAALMTGLVLIGLAWAVAMPTRRAAVALYLLCGLGVLVLAMTRSRGGVMAAGAGILLFVALYRKNRLLPLVLLVGLGALGLMGENRERIFGLTRMWNENAAVPGIIGWRTDIWRATLPLIAERPAMGYGPAQQTFEHVFRNAHPDLFARAGAFHAHNLYLQISYETGWVGLLLFLLWLGTLAWRAIRCWRTNGVFPDVGAGAFLFRGAALVLFCLLIHGLVDLPLARGMWLCFGLMAALVAHAPERKTA